jgi:hypothetical protein
MDTWDHADGDSPPLVAALLNVGQALFGAAFVVLVIGILNDVVFHWARPIHLWDPGWFVGLFLLSVVFVLQWQQAERISKLERSIRLLHQNQTTN